MANHGQYTEEYIRSLVKRSGKSKATVYRKLGDGWTEEEIIAGRKGVTLSDVFPNAIAACAPPANPGIDDLPPPAKPKLAEPPAEDAVSIEPPDDVKFAVTWARAVLWAADNTDLSKSQMSKTKAGSALRYNLFLLGKDDARELHVNLMPKALNILDKNKNPEGGYIAAAEEKSCDELEGILKQAIEESRAQWIETK